MIKTWDLLVFSSIIAEALRRTLWALLRVENEFFNNFENYKTISPDVALSYLITDQLVVYGEFFGQSRSSSNKGFGLIFDTGLIYQLFSWATVDIEFGQRVLGELNDAAHYIGLGSAIKFD